MTKSHVLNTIVVMAVALTTIACNFSGTDEVADSEIVLDGKRILNCDCGESVFEIPYSVTGVAEGTVPEAEADVDWLSRVETEDLAVLAFRVEGNRTPDDRTGRIVLSLAGAEPVIFTVIQAADKDYKTDPSLSFTVNVSEVSYLSAELEITPSNPDSYYYYGVVEASFKDSFETDGDFLAANVEAVEAAARAAAEKYGREYTLEPYLNKGYVKTTLSSLKSETEYVVTVFDLSLAGGYSGRLFAETFTTGRIPASSGEFDIDIDTEKYTITVRPTSSETGTYALEIISLSDWQSYSSPRKCAESFLAYISASGSNVSAYFHEGEFSALYFNPSSQEPSMTNGDYVAYAFATNGERVLSGISYVQFHFEEAR